MVILNRIIQGLVGFFLLSQLLACVHLQQPEQSYAYQLDGEWLYAVGEHRSDRIPQQAKSIQVPSNWWVEGVETSGVLWFYRDVNIAMASKQLHLNFEGVDYQADVFWDGQYLGQHEGYFAPFHFSINIDSTMPQRHLLAVRVYSPKEDSLHWHRQKRLIKGVLSHHDTRPGGAWSGAGQDKNTGGIWGSVWLSPSLGAEVQLARVTTLNLQQDLATLKLELTLKNVQRPMQLRVEIQAPDGTIVYRKQWKSRQATHVQEHFNIQNPALWSSWDKGKPNLYRLLVFIKEGEYLQEYVQKFGVRTIARDEHGRWLLNGEPVFLRGTNHIPSLFLASLTETSLRHDLQLMKEANINAVRVHAHITTSKFYDIADEMGMLIWQDFPLQWGYEDHPKVHASIMRQLEEMVAMLAHHPSIIFWNGHNEAPWSAAWMQTKYPKYDPKQNKELDQAIAQKLQQLDQSRPSQGNSISAEHLWYGWYSDSYQKFSEPQKVTTISELGAQAVPNMETLRTFLREDQLWPMNDKNSALWQYHNFQQHEFTQNISMTMGDSLEILIENSQRYQAHLLQYAVENLRLQVWQPVTGIFQFMFAEHWPSMSWGVMDYLRQPKQGYAVLQQAYQIILPVAQCVQQGIAWQCSFQAINDSNQFYEKISFEVLDQENILTSLVSINRQGMTNFSISYPMSGEGMQLVLRLKSGRVLAKNTYTQAYFQALKP